MTENKLINKQEEEPIRDDALFISNDEIIHTDQIIVPSRLVSADPLIKEVKQTMNKYLPDEYGVIQPWDNHILNIRVAPKNIRRALIIMNYVIKQVRKFGGEITSDRRYTNSERPGCISFFNEKIEFFLEEKVDRFDYQPTEKEIEASKKSILNSYPKWVFIPSGKLTLRIDFRLWGKHGLRKSWSDRRNKKVEDLIPDFLIATVIAANALRNKREHEQDERRLREIEEQRLREIELQRQLEKEKLDELELQANYWDRASRLRCYIDAVEKKKLIENPEGLTDEIIKWLVWARKYANKLDPLK